MLNYIRAEIYKLLHRKYPYIVLGCMVALEALLVGGFMFHNSHSFPQYFGDTITIVTELSIIGACMCVFSSDVVWAGQYKNSTLKNEVSFGLSRTSIYLGKLITQTLLSVVFLVLMMGFYLGFSWVALPHDPILDPQGMQIVGYFLAVNFPLWLAAQAVICFCTFALTSDMAAAFLYFGILVVPSAVLQVVGLFAGGEARDVLLTIASYMPDQMMSAAKSMVGDWSFCWKAWLVGAVWFAAFTAAGLCAFHKREIK